jgi:hypothetical protein
MEAADRDVARGFTRKTEASRIRLWATRYLTPFFIIMYHPDDYRVSLWHGMESTVWNRHAGQEYPRQGTPQGFHGETEVP